MAIRIADDCRAVRAYTCLDHPAARGILRRIMQCGVGPQHQGQAEAGHDHGDERPKHKRKFGSAGAILPVDELERFILSHSHPGGSRDRGRKQTPNRDDGEQRRVG